MSTELTNSPLFRSEITSTPSRLKSYIIRASIMRGSIARADTLLLVFTQPACSEQRKSAPKSSFGDHNFIFSFKTVAQEKTHETCVLKSAKLAETISTNQIQMF